MALNRLCPFKVAAEFWPQYKFYREQREIIESVEESAETYVVAGNKLGKDFVTGFICPCLFLRCLKTDQTCRIVTTSVAEHHLKVLWGEIGRFIATCRVPLMYPRGPLLVNHMEVRRATERSRQGTNLLNYLVGRVSEKGEGLAGHHADVTLFVADEASGVDDRSYEMAQGWAKRMLIFGNPNPCSREHFFRKGVESGDLLATAEQSMANRNALHNAARVRDEGMNSQR